MDFGWRYHHFSHLRRLRALYTSCCIHVGTHVIDTVSRWHVWMHFPLQPSLSTPLKLLTHTHLNTRLYHDSRMRHAAATRWERRTAIEIEPVKPKHGLYWCLEPCICERARRAWTKASGIAIHRKMEHQCHACKHGSAHEHACLETWEQGKGD